MLGERVTIVRRGRSVEVDRYGEPIPGPELRISVEGCALAPRSSSEDNAGRAGVISGLTLYAPPGVRIHPADRIEARSAIYEVEGEPGLWVSPFTGIELGTEVALTRVEG